jgi:hypothetical protein
MAKQTFTTGQVLTAAQMTSLQQTAMGGGAATAKTASYVLVAADAGTTVAMNAAGATTITVNTGLFAAGDTVFIQNLGAGACTVTAGTATVATAGSLILPQNDAGILYFTATGAAIFYDYIQAGAVSPLTTKGDIYTFSTSDARLGVGANGTVLTADSAEATGLKFAAPAGGGANWSLLNSGGTTLSGSSTVTVSGISGKDKIAVFVRAAGWATASKQLFLQFNADGGANYDYEGIRYDIDSASFSITKIVGEGASGQDAFLLGNQSLNASSKVRASAILTGGNASGVKIIEAVGMGTPASQDGQDGYVYNGVWNNSATVTSISLISSSGNFNAGTVFVYTSA